MTIMIRRIQKTIWICIFFAFIGLSEGIYDPAISGIKTKTYRRDPIVANSYDPGEEIGPQQTITYHRTTTIGRLSQEQSSSGSGSGSYQQYPQHLTQQQHQYQQQQQQQQQGSTFSQDRQQNYNDRQQEIPLYQKNKGAQTVSSNWNDAENAITEYYTGCPAGHTGQLPYAYDCRRFINCWHGRGHIQSCGAGTVFNPETLECDRPDKVVCSGLGALGEATQSKYHLQQQQQQQQQQQTQSTKYHAGRLVDATGENIDSLCPLGVSGLQPHPHNCSKFINCANGNVHVQECGPGTAYSIPMMVCDYKDKVDCGDREYTDGYGMLDIRMDRFRGAASNYKNNDVKCPPGGSGLYPHPFDCTKFLNCANGITFIQDCGPGTAFDRLNKVCGYKKDHCDDYTATEESWSKTEFNKYDRHDNANGINISNKKDEYTGVDILCPPGVTGLFVHPFDYTRFLNCQNGNMAVQSCIAGTVFSIGKGFCELKEKIAFTDHVSYIVSEVSYEYSKMLMSCPPGTEGYHLYPYDCTKYIHCTERGRMLIQDCSPNDVFSISQRKCQPKLNVQSHDRVKYIHELIQSVTATHTTTYGINTTNYNTFHHQDAESSRMVDCPSGLNGHHPYPFDGMKYVRCREGQLTIESCASGTAFSLSKRKCLLKDSLPSNDMVLFRREFAEEWSSEVGYGYGYTHHEQIVSCPPDATGMHPHPYDCTKFLNCANGVAHVQSCGPGTAWSQDMEVCVANDKIDCTSDARTPYTPKQDQNSLTFNRESQTVHSSNEIACPDGINDGYYPHPFDNTKYFNCNRGQNSIERCGGGMVFSISRHNCDLASKVDVKDRVTLLMDVIQGTDTDRIRSGFVACPATSSGMYVYPFDCTKYIRCQFGRASIEQCSPGTVFSMSYQICMAQSEVQREDRVDFSAEIRREHYNWQTNQENAAASYVASGSLQAPICPPGATGMHPHPYDCTKFLNCANGETQVQSCGPGTAWSKDMEVCDFKEKVDCTGRYGWESSNTGTVINEITSETNQLMNKIVCPIDIGEGFYPHPFDYSRYFICQNGQSFVGHCNQGFVYSISRRMCDDPERVLATDRVTYIMDIQSDRDSSLSQKFGGVGCPPKAVGDFLYPFDCTKFVKCNRGQTLIEVCPDGATFSLSNRNCMSKTRVGRMDRVAFVTETQNDLYYRANDEANTLVFCPMGFTGSFQHPSDWTKYLDCANGRTVVKMCRIGSVFSVSRSVCEAEINVSLDDRCHNDQRAGHRQDALYYGQNADAVGGSSPHCPAAANGMYPHPYDCSKFLNCANGIANVESCGPGTLWNSQTKVCDFAHKVECRNGGYAGADKITASLSQGSSVKCPSDVSGTLPHPFDCTKFVNCANGEAHIQACGPGTAWSRDYEVCDFIANVDCSNLESSFYNGNRNSKSYGGQQGITNQWSHGDRRFTGQNTGTATSTSYGDRWSNMNMQRPDANAYARGSNTGSSANWSSGSKSDDRYGQSAHNRYVPSSHTGTDTNWAAVGSSSDRVTPGQNVLYMEGSLQPDRNYVNTFHTYKAPLAPLSQNHATTTTTTTGTTNIYYAQPVDSNDSIDEPHGHAGVDRPPYPLPIPLLPPLPDRQNHSRNINHISSSNSRAPIVRHENTLEIHSAQQPPNQQLLPPNTAPAFQNPQNGQPINPPQSHLVAPPPAQSVDRGQRPLDFDASYSDRGQIDITSYDQTASGSSHKPVISNPSVDPPQSHLVPPPPAQSVDRGQRPLDLDASYSDRGQIDITSYDQTASGSSHKPVISNPSVDPPQSHLVPPPPAQSVDRGQGPLDFDASYSDRGQIDITSYDRTASGSSQNPSVDQSNVLGALQPPPISSSSGPFNPRSYQTTPASTKLSPVVQFDQSNLYGGLQPPYSSTTPAPILNSDNSPTSQHHPTGNENVRVYQIYPPMRNATVKGHGDPHYSSPYSGVAHSRNSTWQSSHQTSDSLGYSNGYSPNEHNTSNGYRERKIHSMPPPNDHKHHESASSPRTNEMATDFVDTALPIGDALHMLLRPYFNRSGIVDDETAKKTESHIMRLVVESKSSSTTPSLKSVPNTAVLPLMSSVTPPTPFISDDHDQQRQTDEDVELILAGEQHSLVNGSSRNRTHEVRTELHATQENSNHPHNWHKNNNHSREFHLRHPHIPSPFTSNPKQIDNFNTHPPHPHNHHPHQHHHNRDFHSRHPDMPNPFATREGDKSIVEADVVEIPNPYAEPTTPTTLLLPRISGTNNDCQFDCGNGKCVKQFEVCDGVNNCGNRKDESQCDHLGYEVRLTGGESSHMGRVEVKIRGKWGYVCDDKFGLRDADVVCRELGFNLGASEVRGNSYYPPLEVNFAYVMDEVDCHGNETALKDCNFKGWGVHNCGPDEVVGVVCKVPLFKCPNNYWLCSTSKECIPPAFVCDNTPDCADQSDESEKVCKSSIEYRLEGGRNSNEGRLEVKYRGEWGTVCDDDFSLKEAQVVCNSLGFYGKPQMEKNIYGPGSGPIWLDQVSCLGNETSIDKCNHWAWGEHNCNHTEDVGLRCTAGPPPRHLLNKDPKRENTDDGQRESPFDESEFYQNILERSSKFLRAQTTSNCGRFKSNIFDEYAHPEERVVNGSVAKRGRHPWQATIRTRGRGGISSHWCGAVLIGDGSPHQSSHLLTAAHCLAGYQKGAYFIRMGDHYANIAESSEIDSYIENWYIHEKFRDQTHMNNDIALIVLKSPVRFNDYIQPICLPEKGASLEPERQCTISGWGSIKSGISTPSNILRAAQVPILPDETCKQSHVYGGSLTEGMFCAGSMDESVDACDGDSGGPLVCSDNGAETLYGIISWGQHCGYANKPGVYVKIEKYLDWIYGKINFSLQQNGKAH